jgi:hypothetical protein
MPTQKNEKFKEFVPSAPQKIGPPKNEMNELQQMMSESADT